MMNQEFSRRHALRAGTAAAGTVVLGSLAGCEQVEQLAGDSSDDAAESTETDETEDDEPSAPYRAWLPGPNAFGEDHYFFRYIDYDQFRANESNFDPDVYERNSQAEFLSANFDLSDGDVDGALFVGPVDGSVPAVVTGSFSASDIANYLTDNGAEADQEIGEYTVYRNSSQGVVGLTDGTMVLSGDDTVDQIRTLVETKTGELSRYQDVSDDMATLVERFGPETFAGGVTSEPTSAGDANPDGLRFAGQVGYAYGDSVDGATVATEIAVMFETSEDAETAEISAFTGSDTFAEYEEISSTREGRMVIITGTGPTETLYAN